MAYIVIRRALQTHYTGEMAKTTTLHIRIDEEDEQRIDAIQAEFGGRSEVIRLALAQFLESVERRQQTRGFIDEWASEVGGIDDEEVAEMTAKYFS